MAESQTVGKQALKNIAARKVEVETVNTQLVSCLSESLRIGGQGEAMETKRTVVKEITESFEPDVQATCELTDVKFIPSAELTPAYQQLGEELASPGKCYVTGKGVEVADVGEKATAVLHISNNKGKAHTASVETLTCELVATNTDEKIDCLVKQMEPDEYKISYKATIQGRHQLHIKLEGEHIKGSPFPITVIKKLGTPSKTIREVKYPCGVAVNKRGEIVVGEYGAHCVSIFSSTGEKLHSFGSQGSGHGQFNCVRGVTVDCDGNIFVTDGHNHCIQKFTPDGKFITSVGKKGSNHLEFDVPMGIAIHPLNKQVYIAEHTNHRIQILNPDLTFYSRFGHRGSDDGQFDSPSDVACDNTGNVYVADIYNNRIQVFTAEGEFIRKFGKYGNDNGELHSPFGISINNDIDMPVVYVTEWRNHRVSVFTCEGKFLTSFGSRGNEPGQFKCPCGIAIDKDGVVYVCNSHIDNCCLQLF